MECHRESTSTKVDLLKLMSLECYALSTASRSPVPRHIIQEAMASAKGSIVPCMGCYKLYLHRRRGDGLSTWENFAMPTTQHCTLKVGTCHSIWCLERPVTPSWATGGPGQCLKSRANCPDHQTPNRAQKCTPKSSRETDEEVRAK